MKAFYLKICKLEVVLAAASLLITVFVIFAAALMRTIGLPINWALDIALLLFTWGVFLGADVAYREDRFVNVDLLFVKLPEAVRKPLEFAVYSGIFIFLLTMIYQGSIMSVFTWHRSFQGIPALSYTWVTLSVPVCSLLMIVSTGIKIRRKFFPKAGPEIQTPLGMPK
jgi:TRAP-type C4-dicarboxylate transport system permease small subunit